MANAVTSDVAMVHSVRGVPAKRQLVASTCLTGCWHANSTTCSTAGATASLMRSSDSLTAPSDSETPSTSPINDCACRRLTW